MSMNISGLGNTYTSILDNVTRESVESTLVKNGNRLVRNSIDVSVWYIRSPKLWLRASSYPLFFHRMTGNILNNLNSSFHALNTYVFKWTMEAISASTKVWTWQSHK